MPTRPSNVRCGNARVSAKSCLFEIFSYPYDPGPAKPDPVLCKELYDWKLESWVAAEDLGFDGVFLSEHHFTPYSISPSPNLLVATLAQRTSRMNIGVMANITAFHNPRRLAEEGAMLDHLTGGRLEPGMGRGVDEPEFIREGVKMEETRARFEESVALIQSAWTDRPNMARLVFLDAHTRELYPQWTSKARAVVSNPRLTARMRPTTAC